MLLVHQAGSVKIGEVVRYTFTYTPGNDRVLPTPSHLHLKVKNTSAIPLRAAWVHGPYALHIGAYPATFNPHCKVEDPKKDGVPEYEPMVKAGGSFTTKLLVPEHIRQTGADLGKPRPSETSPSKDQLSGRAEDQRGRDNEHSVTWIVEIASQILFSNSASVGFEMLIGRDERSLEMGFAAVAGHGHGGPGQMKEQPTDQERQNFRKRGNVQTAGVFSKAVRLVVEDTETLWDKPQLPSWGTDAKGKKSTEKASPKDAETANEKPRKRRRVHLVIVTHGLHSNLGADMLFLKESIDATVAQARLDAKDRKEAYRTSEKSSSHADSADQGSQKHTADGDDTATAPLSGGQENVDDNAGESDDEEQTIVRGFNGNAVRTENGIQYLGKRLAKYILRLTYPDQPFLPIKKSFSRTFTDSFKSDSSLAKRDGKASHHGSSVHLPKHQERKAEDLAYKFTSISFVGHSLGGLIQTYAIAYIHKHAPEFFSQIKPVNFICMASPMLGLSNENPMYVRFALDFGLVGRTGRDLGLTWRAPTLAKGGWNALIGGFGGGPKDEQENGKREDPASKPLLRILPTGPAHQILRKFRNRTLYSNVVNDGIVPLRTSCLLFLDWRGLGKVEKARRENGLISTMAEWGWAELTGANASSIAPNVRAEQYDNEDSDDEHVRKGEGDTVPQPHEDETAEDGKMLLNRLSFHGKPGDDTPQTDGASSPARPAAQQDKGMLDVVLDFFRPSTPEKSKESFSQRKTSKALRRAQTIPRNDEAEDGDGEDESHDHHGTTSNPTMRPHIPHLHTGQSRRKRPKATRGDSMVDEETGELQAPPKTSIFESAGDILHPPLPSKQWITDPSTRSRTIFHDRVYHPEDIPPPPKKRPGNRLTRSMSSDRLSKLTASKSESDLTQDSSGKQEEIGSMKVEEKIARAYHRDLSWRKVLVRLEPDAHNNMIVRRMFANAYGWPVIKHLCDTHFADTYAARTRDEDEPAQERAKPADTPIDPTKGEEVDSQTAHAPPPRTQSEMREQRDELADLATTISRTEDSYSAKLNAGRSSSSPAASTHASRVDSADEWDPAYFELSEDGEDSDAVDERNLVSRFINPNPSATAAARHKAARQASASSASIPPASPGSTAHAAAAAAAPVSPVASAQRRQRLGSSGSGRSSIDGHRGLAATAVIAAPTFDATDLDAPLASPSSPVASRVGLRRSLEEQMGAAVAQGKVTEGGDGSASGV